MAPAEGWYPDHENDSLERWWTGHNWSDQRQQRGGKGAAIVVPVVPVVDYHQPVAAGQGQLSYEPVQLGQSPSLQQMPFGHADPHLYPGAYPAQTQQAQQAQTQQDQYGQANAYAGYPIVGPPRRNGLAVASLIVGIIAIIVAIVSANTGYVSTIGVVLAIGFGIRALVVSRETHTGKGLAITGITLGVVSGGIALFMLFSHLLFPTFVVDMSTVESGLHSEIMQQAKVESTVDCPDGHPFAKGDTLTCTATLADGRIFPIVVTVVDNNGGFTAVVEDQTGQ